MSACNFKVFAKPQTLRQAGRPLLREFMAAFEPALAQRGFSLPPDEITDEEYYCRLSALLLCPDGMPPELNEALFAIDALSNPTAREGLEKALSARGMNLRQDEDLTHAEFALRAWLLAPRVVSEEHNLRAMRALSKFFYYGHQEEPGAAQPGSLQVPSADRLDELERALDDWFAHHQRGRRTACVKCYCYGDELWFLIRHGDTFARAAAVEERRTQILHFRPERDDVVVYWSAMNEIRIAARTQGERELYRREFGRLLGGSVEYFSQGRTYTLEPLRRDGLLSLETHDVEGVRKVTLTEVKILEEDGTGTYRVYGSEDLFARASTGGRSIIPSGGRLVRATFKVYFEGAVRPRLVHVEEPNILRLGRHCDGRMMNRFLGLRSFRTPRKSCSGRPEA